MAWDDEPWILDGAAVRVSIVGFDDGSETQKMLDGQTVAVINPDLTSTTDLSQAKVLRENQGISFMGTTKLGAFDIRGDVARSWLNLPNPNERSNAEVVKPWVNGMDVTRQPRDMWIVDFGLMPESEAQEFLVPYEYAKENIKPERLKNNRISYREKWWQHGEARPAMRKVLAGLDSYIVTPRVAKHRIFVKLAEGVIPDSRLFVFAPKEPVYTFGLLSSKIHEVWTLATCSWHGVGNDPTYNTTTCFETFPFPRPTETQHADIEKWAKYLDTVRSQLLAADEKRTMTKLYNDLAALRETRDSKSPVYALLIAHDKLDAAVAVAYGWAWPLSDEAILERLLALNLERAAQQDVSPTTETEMAVSTVDKM